jgi:hypothetical protein
MRCVLCPPDTVMAVVEINGRGVCKEHIDEAMHEAFTPVRTLREYYEGQAE